MFEGREFVEDGGLISYGSDAARPPDKMLKGADPANLPIEQSRRFEVAVNSKSAKAIGLSLPPILLARDDEVIEQSSRTAARDKPVRSC
jgi:putative ABC transport system substrate-binding protein